MARLTFANVNKALKDACIDAEVVKNKGDFFVWFCGDEPSSWNSSATEVCYLNQIPSVVGWVEKYKAMKSYHDSSQ